MEVHLPKRGVGGRSRQTNRTTWWASDGCLMCWGRPRSTAGRYLLRRLKEHEEAVLAFALVERAETVCGERNKLRYISAKPLYTVY